MSVYPGDIYYFTLSIIKADGTAPSVTSAPVISVVNLSGGANVLSPPSQSMTLISGSQALYYYAWSIPGNQNAGTYASLVSYAADGITVNSRFGEQVVLGDSRVTGVVALDATCAKESTSAKDATVAHGTDLVALSPDNSSAVLAIKAQTDRLPAAPADNATSLQLVTMLQDLSDAETGTWTIDKTQNPRVLTFQRPGGAVLYTYLLTDDDNATARSRQ